MGPSLADQLRAWLALETTKWELSHEVVDWAEGFGDDVRRAWMECPRADFLMALAGLLEAPRALVLAAAATAGRDAVNLLPKKMIAPRKAVFQAAGYRPVRDPRPPKETGLVRSCDALLGDYEAEVERLTRALHDTQEPAARAVVEMLARRIHEPGLYEKFAADPGGPGATEVLVPLLVEALALPAVRRLETAFDAYHLLMMKVHAVRAAVHCDVAAGSARIYDAAVVAASWSLEAGRGAPSTDARFREASRLALRSGTRVYTEAARIFDHATRAQAHAHAVSTRMHQVGLTMQITAMLLAVGGMSPEELVPKLATRLPEMLEGRAADGQAEAARRVREIIPAVAVPMLRTAEELVEAARRDPRGILQRGLSAMLPNVRLLGDGATADAVELALAIVEAPGPLRKKALAPALRAVHGEMMRMFRARANETEGAAREEAQAAAGRAAEAVREMEAIVAAEGREPAN